MVARQDVTIPWCCLPSRNAGYAAISTTHIGFRQMQQRSTIDGKAVCPVDHPIRNDLCD